MNDNEKALKESLKNYLNTAEDSHYSFDKALLLLPAALGKNKEIFVNDPTYQDQVRDIFSNLRSYDEQRLNDYFLELEEEVSPTIDLTKKETPKSEEELQQQVAQQSYGMITQGNVYTAPAPTFHEQMEALEDEIEVEQKPLAKAVREATFNYDEHKKAQEYGFAYRKNDLYQVTDEGEIITKAVKYNGFSKSFEIQQQYLNSPEVIRITLEKAKRENWEDASLTPPKGANGQVFMETALREFLNPTFGFEPENIHVPKEYEGMKAMIAAELRNGLKVEKGNQYEEDEQELKNEAENEAPAPVNNEPEPPAPQKSTSTESTSESDDDMFNNREDQDDKTVSGSEENGEKQDSQLSKEEQEALAGFDNDVDLDDFVEQEVDSPEFKAENEVKEPEFENSEDKLEDLGLPENDTVDLEAAKAALQDAKKDEPSDNQKPENKANKSSMRR